MDHRLRILVIDDDEDDFVVTRDILRDVWEDDVDVHWVSTYLDGLEAVREGKHDACLLDYHLGAKTGVDLMTELGDGAARMPIILMTGSDEASVDLAAMKAGAADYLVKGQSSAGLVERSVRYAIARLQAEKQRRLASVVEFAHDAIIEVGADGAIRSWNAGAFRVFGLTSDQAVGQSITCMGFNDEALLGGLLDQVRWGVKVEKAEALVTREGGDEIWVSTQVSPAAAGDGEGFSVIARDITDSKQAELRRNNFVSIASHELRTPMTAILGFSELLLMRDVPDELRREWLQAINSDGRRMAAIIESLLNVSTIQSGRLEVVLEPLDLEAVLDGVITSVAAGSPERRIVVDVAAGLPAVVADSGKLVEVLSNLVGNALKYSPAGGAVSIDARTEGDGRVVVSVTDEGLGIAAPDIEQLFTSFHRVRRPETVAIRGTGLGLYIVKSLVEMMNGTIDVSSELNVGSTFRVTFPAEAVGRFRLAS